MNEQALNSSSHLSYNDMINVMNWDFQNHNYENQALGGGSK